LLQINVARKSIELRARFRYNFDFLVFASRFRKFFLKIFPLALLGIASQKVIPPLRYLYADTRPRSNVYDRNEWKSSKTLSCRLGTWRMRTTGRFDEQRARQGDFLQNGTKIAIWFGNAGKMWWNKSRESFDGAMEKPVRSSGKKLCSFRCLNTYQYKTGIKPKLDSIQKTFLKSNTSHAPSEQEPFYLKKTTNLKQCQPNRPKKYLKTRISYLWETCGCRQPLSTCRSGQWTPSVLPQKRDAAHRWQLRRSRLDGWAGVLRVRRAPPWELITFRFLGRAGAGARHWNARQQWRNHKWRFYRWEHQATTILPIANKNEAGVHLNKKLPKELSLKAVAPSLSGKWSNFEI